MGFNSGFKGLKTRMEVWYNNEKNLLQLKTPWPAEDM